MKGTQDASYALIVYQIIMEWDKKYWTLAVCDPLYVLNSMVWMK